MASSHDLDPGLIFDFDCIGHFDGMEHCMKLHGALASPYVARVVAASPYAAGSRLSRAAK